MKRYIGFVEEIDWSDSTCKLRIPNLDGLAQSAYADPAIALLRQIKTKNADLEVADIPYHLQGLRIHDIVYCLDSEDEGDNFTIVGFFGSNIDDKEG